MYKKLLLSAAISLLTIPVASAQDGEAPAAGRVRPPVSQYAKPAAFPNENKAAVAAAMSRARKIAGDDLFLDFAHRCIISPRYPTRVSGIQHNGVIDPVKIFDNFYSVGQNSVSAFALTTSDGIVLIDALNNEDEAKNIIVPNMVAMGLDPRNIKYIVISHGHGDHYGGARYLQKTYGAKVISSKVDWDAMTRTGASTTGAFAGLEPPVRDIEIQDGQVIKLGNADLRFYVTPGHTLGTLSMTFKVSEAGQQHTVGYFGGTGGGRTAPLAREQIKSLVRWRDITRQAGVDTLIANHPLHDRSLENNMILRYRQSGESNPYIIGADRYQRYFQIMEECSRVTLGLQGFAE